MLPRARKPIATQPQAGTSIRRTAQRARTVPVTSSGLRATLRNFEVVGYDSGSSREVSTHIATGGGAYVDPATRKLLNERAITIWLDAPIDILTERTSRRDTRAQLRNGDPKSVLERLAHERRPSYSEAHIHVKSGDGAHKDVVDAIVDALEKHLTNHLAPPE